MSRKFSHVIVIGVDGAGSWFRDADTPNFDRIFENGAVTYNALSSKPTISAECWGSMLIGVGPEIHGLTNEIVSTVPYDVNSPFPSLFRRIREAYPDAVLGSYCDWNPITYGIVENNIGVSHDTAHDTELTPVVCDYIRKNKPDFLFIHFDSVDGAGHSTGYGLPAFIDRIHEVDKLIGDVYSATEKADMLKETLFVVIADHGGANNENNKGSHGGWTDGEKYVTFAAAGKGVNKTEIEVMNIRDLAAIVLYAMGIESPGFDEKGWTAQIPEGLFADYKGEYRDISHLTGAAPRVSKIHHTSELI
jgi:predicted AlkP superfamily pyrophosphatase or phosphodiesterase